MSVSLDDLAAEVAKRLTIESDLSPEVVRGLADAVADHVEAVLKPIREQIAGLMIQIDAVRNDAMRYCGVWGPGEYSPPDVCTDHGALWLARRETSTRPGTSDSGWQLIAKGK